MFFFSFFEEKKIEEKLWKEEKYLFNEQRQENIGERAKERERMS